MRFRKTSAVAVAVLALAGLTACQTNVGTAAWVDGHRITESDVARYLNPSGIASSAAANAQKQGQTIPAPRTSVLQILIDERVFERTLQGLNVRFTEGELAGYHDAAASLLLNSQIGGSALDTAIDKQLPSSGIKSSFRDVFLRMNELEYKIIKAEHLTQFSQLVALVKRAKISISVNPRFGQWDIRSLGLKGTVVPGYLTPRVGSATGH